MLTNKELNLPNNEKKLYINEIHWHTEAHSHHTKCLWWHMKGGVILNKCYDLTHIYIKTYVAIPAPYFWNWATGTSDRLATYFAI